MNRIVHWNATTLGELAAAAGAALERGAATRRICAFSVPADSSSALVEKIDGPGMDRFTVVAVPQGAGAAAALSAIAAAGAVALVERELPVPAAMAVLRVPVLADAIARLASARRAASRARVLAVVGADAAAIAVPLAATCKRRWRTVSAMVPGDLDAALLALTPSTDRAVVVLDAANLVSFVADMSLAAPALVVAALPRPGDPAPLDFAAALPSTSVLILDDADPRAGLIRQSASCRVLAPSALLGSAGDPAGAAHGGPYQGPVVVPARGRFTCRGLVVHTSLPPAAVSASRLAAAAALFTGTDALDIADAFARLLPAAMPHPVPAASAFVEAASTLARAV